MADLPTAQTGRIAPIQPGLFSDCGESDEERAFADAYVSNGFSPADAYIEAKRGLDRSGKPLKRGAARKMAAEWLQKNAVRCYLAQRLGALAEAAELSQAEIVQAEREVIAMGLGKIPGRRTLIGKDGPMGERMVYDTNLAAVNGAAALLSRILGIASGEGDGGSRAAPVLSQSERAARLAGLLERARRAREADSNAA